MSATATDLITPAFRVLNVYQLGQTIPAAALNDALGYLNRWISSLSQMTIPVIAREVFDTVANQGGPSTPYTIGSGGDFDTTRPPNQAGLKGAGLLQFPGQTNEVEIPRGILTDDGWEAIQVKTLTNSMWTNVYYNPTYASNLGTINLWPIPDNADYDLVLYLSKPLEEFADLATTTYDFPPGAEQMIVDNLVTKIAAPWGAQLTDDMKQQAVASLSLFKRTNTKLTDVMNDYPSRDRRYGYNIYTGNF